jgi:cysteine sulfinate desulfinase/cysteine desulfurase-like protein
MGISENDALQTIRISLTHGFDILEISHACDVISDTIGKITA